MSRFVILTLSVFFFFCGVSNAGKYGFETTSDGIAESLLAPGTGSKTTKQEGWESVAPPAIATKNQEHQGVKKG